MAVLTREPEAAGSMVAVAVNVTPLPEGRVTNWSMLPLPLAAQDPPEPTQVQVMPVREAGKASTTWALAALGPAFETLIA